jgi:hypothetical protein
MILTWINTATKMQHHSLLQALMEKVEAVRLLLSLSQPSIDINKNPLDIGYSALGIMATQKQSYWIRSTFDRGRCTSVSSSSSSTTCNKATKIDKDVVDGASVVGY